MSEWQYIETWLMDEGLILPDAPRTRQPKHGSCCTCQTCGFHYDDCCCDENERTARWQAFKARFADSPLPEPPK